MLSAIMAILSLLEQGLPVAENLITLAKQEFQSLTGSAPALTSEQQQQIDSTYQASVTAVQNAQPAAQ